MTHVPLTTGANVVLLPRQFILLQSTAKSADLKAAYPRQLTPQTIPSAVKPLPLALSDLLCLPAPTTSQTVSPRTEKASTYLLITGPLKLLLNKCTKDTELRQPTSPFHAGSDLINIASIEACLLEPQGYLCSVSSWPSIFLSAHKRDKTSVCRKILLIQVFRNM